MLDNFVGGDFNLFNNNKHPFGKHFRLKIDNPFQMKYLSFTMEPVSFEKM